MATAIVYTRFGDPDVLQLVEVPDARPDDGEVVVRVEAVGVNPIDGKLRAGLRPSGAITEPRRVGSDAAGVVTAVGADVEGLRVGDPVVVNGAVGAYASELVVSAERVYPRPPGVTAAAGAAVGVPVSTAYQALRSLAVGGGDTLLLHGGSGAVGQAAIQWAVLRGARVIATTSGRRADRVRELGAEPVAYGPGLADRVRDLAPDGVSVALDAAGTDEALQTSIELVGDRSRIATLVRGRDAGDLGIRAFSGGSPVPLTAREQAWRSEGIAATLPLLAIGAFSVELGPQLPLSDAVAAHRLVEGGTDGKIVLLP